MELTNTVATPAITVVEALEDRWPCSLLRRRGGPWFVSLENNIVYVMLGGPASRSLIALVSSPPHGATGVSVRMVAAMRMQRRNVGLATHAARRTQTRTGAGQRAGSMTRWSSSVRILRLGLRVAPRPSAHQQLGSNSVLRAGPRQRGMRRSPQGRP
jgi:hypothetical protein